MTDIDDSEALDDAADYLELTQESIKGLRAYASNLRQQLADANAKLERLEAIRAHPGLPFVIDVLYPARFAGEGPVKEGACAQLRSLLQEPALSPSPASPPQEPAAPVGPRFQVTAEEFTDFFAFWMKGSTKALLMDELNRILAQRPAQPVHQPASTPAGAGVVHVVDYEMRAAALHAYRKAQEKYTDMIAMGFALDAAFAQRLQAQRQPPEPKGAGVVNDDVEPDKGWDAGWAAGKARGDARAEAAESALAVERESGRRFQVTAEEMRRFFEEPSGGVEPGDVPGDAQARQLNAILAERPAADESYQLTRLRAERNVLAKQLSEHTDALATIVWERIEPHPVMTLSELMGVVSRHLWETGNKVNALTAERDRHIGTINALNKERAKDYVTRESLLQQRDQLRSQLAVERETVERLRREVQAVARNVVALKRGMYQMRPDGYEALLRLVDVQAQPSAEPITVEADPTAPKRVAELPAYWDERRKRQGKPDTSRCAAELRVALEASTEPAKPGEVERIERLERAMRVLCEGGYFYEGARFENALAVLNEPTSAAPSKG